MKKLPDTIKVGPRTYKIILCRDAEIGITNMAGECNPQASTIRILRNMAPTSQWETLFHEVLHGICYDRGINLPEECVTSLSNGFFQVLLDNNMIKIDGGKSPRNTTRKRKIGFTNEEDRKNTKDVPKKV